MKPQTAGVKLGKNKSQCRRCARNGNRTWHERYYRISVPDGDGYVSSYNLCEAHLVLALADR